MTSAETERKEQLPHPARVSGGLPRERGEHEKPNTWGLVLALTRSTFSVFTGVTPAGQPAVSYTHLTLPTIRA